MLMTADRNPGVPPFDQEAAPNRASMLNHYLSVLRRRRWIILCAVLASLAVGLIVTLLMTPLYTASTTLEIQREQRDLINVQGAEPEANPADLEFYQTQYGLLRARSLADRVATQLRLFDDQNFFAMYGSSRASDWFEAGRPTNASTRADRIQEAGEILLDNLTVSPERMSRLVEISFSSPDPAFSQRVVDAWATHFIQATLERRFEANSYARRFLEQRLAQLRARLDESERLVVGYAARERIINLPATTPSGQDGGGSGERSLMAEDLVAINRELARATAERMQAQSRLGSSDGMVVEALENTAISGLRQRRAELAAEYARLMTQFEPAYPPAQALSNQLQQIDQAIQREERRVRGTLQATYAAAAEREQALRSRVGDLEGSMLDLRRRSIQYNIFQRDVDTNRELYDGLLQRYKEIGIAGGVGVNNISIVDRAQAPQERSSPNPLLNVALALAFGLALGVGAALALEQIDEAVTDPTEVEGLLKLPLLGTIPKVTDIDPMDALQDRKSSLAEAYLSIQTNLAFSTDHGVPASLAVTSTRPAEGKTTTSYAIARSLARAGRRTLFIDADMRSPSAHHLLALGNDRGLSNYLAGSEDLSALIQPVTSHDGLHVMTAGPQPPSAAELLSGDRLERMIAALRGTYDNIVIDAPPVMGLADAPLISSKVEATVFVIESRGTKRGMVQLAVQRLRAARAQIVGVVLAKFESKHAHYGYGYDYGYGYGSNEQRETAG